MMDPINRLSRAMKGGGLSAVLFSLALGSPLLVAALVAQDRSPSPTPTPEPGKCSPKCRISQTCEPQNDGTRKCVDPQWLPVSCVALPDDPIGLERSGPGCDSKGGSGTGVITVTALGPDGAPGTLRDAYNKINARSRRVVCDPHLQGDIVLDNTLRWEKPFTTLDLSACDVTIKASKPATNIIVIRDTHDVIVYSARGQGWYTGDPAWKRANNATVFGIASDSGTKHPTARNILLDRVTATGCEDDCLGMMWGGVQDTTVSRGLIQGYHPSALGAWSVPLPLDKWRLRIAHMYNVWFDSGERQPKPREQTHLWVFARNLVYNWKWYRIKQADGTPTINWPMGLNISDDYPDENDLGWVVGACFLPGPGSVDPILGDHSKWGVIVGNSLTCDGCGNCGCELWDLSCCNNKKLKNSRYYYEGVEGPSNLEGRTWPVGYVPVPLPFIIDKTRPWSRVLAEVGVAKRNAVEQAVIDRIAAELPKCKVPR